ncbi:sugar ABC transporter permease [Microbacterium sp. 10M-3C3]|uniref:carbohydrate ABC transporter permease n=1 Tax=Microbacterium sp. 10M-3C3 TaxID=2483401 RepID=UPI000F63C270|nr:sugar ABC transporter permease [Microbacterium sp. 10M-3C3]
MALAPVTSARRPERRRPTALSRRSAATGAAFVLPAALLLVVFFGAPLSLSIVMSFFDWPLFGQRTPVGLDNYAAILDDDIAMQSIGFTLYYTVLVTVLTFVVSFFLALLVQKGGRAVGFFRTAIFIPSAIGFGLAGLLWGFLYNAQIGVFSGFLQALGLADGPVLFFQTQTSSLWAVIVMVVWKSLGLNTLVMLVGLQSIPVELYEAARVDGASWWQRTRLITLPLMRPTFALLLVLGVSGALLSFDQFFVLTAGGPDRSTITMVYAIYRAAFTQFHLGYAAAIGVVLMVVLLLVNIVQLRFLRTKD